MDCLLCGRPGEPCKDCGNCPHYAAAAPLRARTTIRMGNVYSMGAELAAMTELLWNVTTERDKARAEVRQLEDLLRGVLFDLEKMIHVVENDLDKANIDGLRQDD